MLLIIDPASTEFNRGSFCYLPYIFYSEAKDLGFDVQIIENFSVANLDSLPKADNYYVALWSYPQIDACLAIYRFLEGNVKFFGYYPLIDQLGLPKENIHSAGINKGIAEYPKYFEYFKYILLSDCDMHLAEYEGTVYPMFTSYGCPNGCTFCPSTANCEKYRTVLPLSIVKENLQLCWDKGYRNIHFTDEDFFFDKERTFSILEAAKKIGKFNFIALGHINTVTQFIKKYGENVLEDAGMKLIEVGLETASDLSGDMGKNYVITDELLISCKIPILWLTMTFFPGETLDTIRQTGSFLKIYGFPMERMKKRLRTNGTYGGLGQFFQAYPGTPIYKNIGKLGTSISSRPIRLLPSFLPKSFLDCKIQYRRSIIPDDSPWFDLYKSTYAKKLPEEGITVSQFIFNGENRESVGVTNRTLFIALCARLGIL